VGREEQVEILLRRWAQAKAGEGQVVLISGEPGIGKSRLVQALQERIAHDSYQPVTLQCSPFHIHSALHPLIEVIERLAGFEAGDTNEAKLRKLEAWLEIVDLPLDQVAPLYASLLALPTGDRYPPPDVSPQRQKEMMLNAHVERFSRLPSERPVLFLVEDVHWIDPTSMELLDRQIERVHDISTLLIITYRPEFAAPWIGRSYVTSMTLNRLDRRNATAMTDVVTGDKVLPIEVRDQIIQKTDGVPLFIEEMTKSVLESAYSSVEPGNAFRVPETLQDSLEARLDRLGPVKDVAQIGAAIGRTFNHDLLAHVVPVDGQNLTESLGALVHSGLVTVRGEPPRSTYTFSHALIRDTAYNSLLRSRRAELHGRIVSALEKEFPEIVSSEPQILAHHCSEANLNEQAIDYWLQAGQRAMSRSANVEANEHLRKGLVVLESLPESSQRDRQELMLQTTLGMSLVATEGFGSFDVVHAFRRAHLLCRDIGDTPELIPVLWGTWWFHEVRGELETAGELAKQLYDLAQGEQDQGHLLPAYRAMGQTLFWKADFPAARQNLEQAIAIYVPVRHRTHAFLYGQDPGVAARNFVAHCLWISGYPDQALARMQEAVAMEDEFSHPFSHAFALTWASLLARYRRENRPAHEHAETALMLSREQGFSFFHALATILRGAATAEQGEEEDGIAEMRKGIDMYRATGANSETKITLALIAEAHGKIGQFEKGLDLLVEALADSDAREVRCYDAELNRLKGIFLMAQDSTGDKAEEAEACFHDALELARAQNAKSWELRAATSLAHLWQSQGKTSEAHDLLSPVYGWFTEGFDTPDLQDAKALLDKLS
jgi:predicted ATPase